MMYSRKGAKHAMNINDKGLPLRARRLCEMHTNK